MSNNIFKMLAGVAVGICLLAGTAMSQSVHINTLDKRGDIYYRKGTNTTFTGTVDAADCEECGYMVTIEMKNGKFHGRYSMMDEESTVTGFYKDGKKDGEWVYETEEGGRKIEIYKDGKLISKK